MSCDPRDADAGVIETVGSRSALASTIDPAAATIGVAGGRDAVPVPPGERDVDAVNERARAVQADGVACGSELQDAGGNLFDCVRSGRHVAESAVEDDDAPLGPDPGAAGARDPGLSP